MINEEKRLLKVFLCHASGDKPPVRKLYKELVAEGVDAWLDQEKLLPGQDWRLEIPKAVEEADVVVICLSKKSITKEGYVQKEIKFALDIAEEKPEGTIFLIPARLEECIVPERLSHWQWVDLYEEDGFVKLLRSLKLRANKVGAVIELISYQESDKEIQHRLNQLYTDGLAAFYTEDWDKACFCFQTILSERPDHRNATEKLAEAECERKLARLYVSSTEAVQSENWPVAIETLEELLQKSPDYKDAAQLLRDARKREQLQELYAEAKTLYDAQKWRAVVKVFEQISVLEPNYPDANSLLASAEKEVAEADRLARLNEQYSQALRAMDGDDWYEARKLLEIVHKSQTGFLETEKLLRKVENGILREEEKRRQHEQIETLYEQAHGFVRSQKWRKALDKLEEIRALDDQFSDPDQLATRIETELEHEEQEAERQDRLAALYAEAVRLLKEGRSQEALDKWHEINGIDPKYPDRQWVQRTAKKALTRQAKSTPAKAQFAISKSIWIGLSGIAVVASLMLGIYLTTRGNGDLNLPDPGDPQNNNTSSSGPVDPQVLPPKLELRVNYGDNWVESFYEAGHKVKITLTQSDGVSVKATAKVVTEPKEDWNGVPGFQTSDSSWFDADGNSMAGRPDIQPSDWVIGSVDNGATAKVQIGNIHGAVDLTGDSIEGSISAPWFPDKLGVECHPWGAPESTDMKFDTVEPNGVDPYACSWAGEWDIQWNQRVGVGYFGPDGHWVANTFVSPTIRAHAVWDSVDAWNWPQGAVLHLTIDDPDTLRYPDLEMDMSAQVDPDLGSVWFDFAGKYDLKPGDEVTLTNGVTTKRLIVSILSINTVDIEADTVSGSAEPGALVRLPVPKELFATADPEGNWVANLVEVGVNVGPGTSLIAELNDDDGDMTSFEMDVR